MPSKSQRFAPHSTRMFRRAAMLLLPGALVLTSTAASAIPNWPGGPIDPPIPTIDLPLAPTVVNILRRDHNRVDYRFRDRATNETGYAVQRRVMPSGSWQTVANYPARSNTGTYTTYFDNNVTGDTRYCYRAVASNADGSAYSSQRCAYTKEADATPVWRAQLRIETASVNHADTDNSIRVALNDSSSYTLPYGNQTWLNYSHDDFETGSDFVYDLSLDSLGSLEDVTRLQLYKEGSDAICIREIELLINEEPVFTETYGNTSSTCKWLDNDPGYTPYLSVFHAELRDHDLWDAFDADIPLVFDNDELISRVESMLGDASHGNALKWGHKFGPAYVETSVTNNTTLHFDADLEADLDWLPNPEVDIDFDLVVGASCSGSDVNITIETANFEVDADNGLVGELTEAFVCAFSWDWNCVEEEIEQEVLAAFEEVAIEASFEDLGICPNPGYTPAGDLVFIGGS